jgi:hypothetical protein
MAKYLDKNSDHALSEETAYQGSPKPKTIRGKQHSTLAIVVCVLFVAAVIGFGLRTFMQTTPAFIPSMWSGSDTTHVK